MGETSAEAMVVARALLVYLFCELTGAVTGCSGTASARRRFNSRSLRGVMSWREAESEIKRQLLALEDLVGPL